MLFSRNDYESTPDEYDPYEPMERRSLFFHGLSLTLQRFPVLLWAFVFNLFYAALTTIHMALAIGAITDHSLASRPLLHGFDLGTLASLFLKLNQNRSFDPDFRTAAILYLGTYFLLVPGALFCYQTDTPARLSTLLRAGILHFWRFIRILILFLIVVGILFVPLAMAYARYSDYLDAHILGRTGFLFRAAFLLIAALLFALVRLYFDLIEAYTVQIGLQERSNGRPDRRVRRTLLPALRALKRNFFRTYFIFLLLAALGFTALFFSTRFSLLSLAGARAWPIFAATQAGVFLMLLTRFWQRGAETTLTLDYPILEEESIPIARASFIPIYEPEPAPPPATMVDPPPASIVEPQPAAASLVTVVEPLPTIVEPPQAVEAPTQTIEPSQTTVEPVPAATTEPQTTEPIPPESIPEVDYSPDDTGPSSDGNPHEI